MFRHLRSGTIVLLAVVLLAAVCGTPATADTTTRPVAGVSGDLFGVACTSRPFCLAAGFNRTSPTSSSAVVLPATDGVGGGTETVGGPNAFFGVACVSSENQECLAVGGQGAGAQGVAVVDTVTNGLPGTVKTVPGVYAFYGVACASATTCFAVGFRQPDPSNPSVHAGVVVPITNGTPGAVQTVSGAFALVGVACASETSCVAVGDAGVPVGGTSLDDRGVVVPITNGVASGAEQVGGASGLSGVGCGGTSPPACEAVGSKVQSISQTHVVGVTVQVTSSGAIGSVSTVDAGTTTGFSGVACDSATSCVAVGSTNPTTDGADQVGVYVSIANGSPGAVRKVSGSSSLLGVGCTGPSSCVASGFNRSYSSSPPSDTGVLALIGAPSTSQPTTTTATGGTQLPKIKQRAKADLPVALKNAITYCTPTILGGTSFGTGVLLIGSASALAVAGALTAYATTPFCVATLRRLAYDYRIVRDPPDPSYDTLANPVAVAPVEMPSCSKFEGSDGTFCTKLSTAEAGWVHAAQVAASAGEALSTTVDRESAAATAGDQAAATRQDDHLQALEQQLQSAVADEGAAWKTVAALLAAEHIGYRVTKTQSGETIQAVERWLGGRDVPADELRRIVGVSALEPRAIEIVEASSSSSGGTPFGIVLIVAVLVLGVVVALVLRTRTRGARPPSG